MTWYFDPSGTSLDVYDHDGVKVASGREFVGSWRGRFPSEVLTIMQEQAEAAIANSNNEYAIKTVLEMAGENIEEGTPP